MIPNTAMIFAAGFGTRMGDLTKKNPKPMLHLGGKPMIDTAVELVRSAGISHIIANTHYKHGVLEPHLRTLGVDVVHEKHILETGGGLKAALPLLRSDPVLTLNPDAAWFGPNPVAELCDHWHDDMSGLLLCVQGAKNSDFSIESGAISRGGPYRYTGAQILRVDRLIEISETVFSLNAYWDLLMKRGSLHAHVYSGDWMDIGTPAGLQRANDRRENK